MRKHKLDKEEEEILDAIQSGEWKLIRPKKLEFARYVQIAKNTLRKDQRMNIRISKADLDGIKAKAAEQGIPYQTLVASIIHKYVSSNINVA